VGRSTGNLRSGDPKSLASRAAERGMINLSQQHRSRWRLCERAASVVANDPRSSMPDQLSSPVRIFGHLIANVYSRGTETVGTAKLGQIVKSVQPTRSSQALRNAASMTVNI